MAYKWGVTNHLRYLGWSSKYQGRHFWVHPVFFPPFRWVFVSSMESVFGINHLAKHHQRDQILRMAFVWCCWLVSQNHLQGEKNVVLIHPWKSWGTFTINSVFPSFVPCSQKTALPPSNRSSFSNFASSKMEDWNIHLFAKLQFWIGYKGNPCMRLIFRGPQKQSPPP